MGPIDAWRSGPLRRRGDNVKLYQLDEKYRIGTDGTYSFTLEQRQVDKKTGQLGNNWRTLEWHSDVPPLLASWARKLTLESDAELPAALTGAMAELARVQRDLATLSLLEAAGACRATRKGAGKGAVALTNI